MTERWARVLMSDNSVSDVSLSELFRNAHLYQSFVGDNALQDFAVMRVVLAVMHASIGQGVRSVQDARDTWRRIWDSGKLPADQILAYLDRWADRFWLVHPDRPFFQRPCASKGTGYDILKLDGNLLQSNHKARFFTESGGCRGGMGFAEAARWLLYLNAYDDNSAKASTEYRAAAGSGQIKKESAGAGWLGRCGPVFFSGDDLFRTLMLNFVLLDDKCEPHGSEKPCWELDVPRDGERSRINVPDNLSELYTLQTRRIILDLDGSGEFVVGYHSIGGDFFEPANAFIEPMTLWSMPDIGDKQAQQEEFYPRRHRPQERFWRALPGLLGCDFVTGNSRRRTHKPGIVTWAGWLADQGILGNIPVRVSFVSMQYADVKCFNVADMFSDGSGDGVRIEALLDPAWQEMISESVSGVADKLAAYVWNMARSAAESDGMDEKGSKAFASRQQAAFYMLAEGVFRKWLHSLDPDTQDCSGKAHEFRRACIDCARRMPDIVVRELSPQALFGRPGSKQSAASAVNLFSARLRRFDNGE